MALGWFVSLREQLFARRIVKDLLKSHAVVRARQPQLVGPALYREVLLHSGAVDATQVNHWLVDAEDSVDQWTAPGRHELGLREVAHFLVMSSYRDKGKPGATISFGAIVNSLIPEHL
jgi:hypothetical protein